MPVTLYQRIQFQKGDNYNLKSQKCMMQMMLDCSGRFTI